MSEYPARERHFSSIARVGLPPLLAVLVLCALLTDWRGPSAVADESRRVDPSAWGSDHVGKPVPDYVTGDECLFCHRMDIGPGFAGNRHNQTIRPIDEGPDALKALKADVQTKGLAETVVYLLGGAHRQRYLKPARAYGQLDILSAQWVPPRVEQPGRLLIAEAPRWDETTFAEACAGCHTTAVEANTRAFSAVSLDCYVCHGAVDPNHSKDPILIHLSKARRDPPRVVISLCAQCHARTGRSRSSGRPYPNTFVAGDNLFRDFVVDFSPKAVASLHPADRHILENIRNVATLGEEGLTCLSCHNIHGQSSAKHRTLERSALCLNCHDATGRETTFDTELLHSTSCQY
jgi:predicted CXXCH cytochrome family protein